MDLEEIKAKIRGKSIEEVLATFDWKGFEDFVAEVFAENGFRVERRVRFKTDKRYEIDIIATRLKIAICADCKHWSRGRYKTSGLKTAALNQEKRVEELKKLRKEFKHLNCYPALITLFEEGVVKEHETFIIPVWKLNSFLCSLESYL
jgi:Holliday junction resolvase-like predicted endonuclease